MQPVVAGAAWVPPVRGCGLYAPVAGRCRADGTTIALPAGRLAWFEAAPRTLTFDRRRRRRRHRRLVAERRQRGARRVRTLWRNAHLTTLAAAAGWGFIRRGALVVDGDSSRWVGADGDLPAGLAVDAEITPRRRAGHARPGRLPHPPRLRRPARARVRAAPRGRELRGHRPRRRRHPLDRRGHARGQRRRALLRRAGSAPCALMAEGVTTLEIKSGYGLSALHEARCLRVARRLGARAAADGAHHLPVGATRCRPSSTAAPTTTSTPSAPGCRRCTRRGWSTRSTPSASASPSRRRRPGACSRPRTPSACR